MTEPTPPVVEPEPEQPPTQILVDMVLADAVHQKEYWQQQRQQVRDQLNLYDVEITRVQAIIDLCQKFKRLYEASSTRLEAVKLERDALRQENNERKRHEQDLVDHAYERAAAGGRVQPDRVWTELNYPPPPAPEPAPDPVTP